MNKEVKKYSTGRLSQYMKDMIPVWFKQGMTLEEISDRIDRSPVGIQKFLRENGFLDENLPVMDSDAKIIATALHNKPYWRDLRAQFDAHELASFENMWVRMMMEQFRQDLLPAEELQVKQLLTLDIFMNRSAIGRREQIKEIAKIQKDLDAEYEVDIENRDTGRIEYLESKLAFARSAVGNHTTEHTKLLGEIKQIIKDLKATRDQRVKRIEDSKTSFTGLIRALEDADYRKRMGYEAELMNVAKNKALVELSEWHEYGTGTDYKEMDIPILNADTVQLHDDI